jgi:anti-sigma regulatory factor (Ser/Thr protein kinase)
VGAARVAGVQVSTGGPRLGTHGLVSGSERGAPTRRRERALPADATAPRQARALLEAVVTEWGVDGDLHEDAAMVVTELVANAVDHAGTPSTVILGLDERGLYLAVRDGRPGPAPRARPVDPAAPRGRGLQMIDALAASWGVTVHEDGKTVWAVLRRA